ncbi:NAD-dependent epimerase/dehydratase family protein [Sphingomonas montanisoli]|uniref:NAD-dependent epimerase/dehydratase family protein n=1 Tax=Sphingomonas montanisoli TaxID=2606412 RepID=UPI0015E19FFE|nr:NAD-dependent epimerase/dehydratase family protein [Sphingomonas montanisoli]
MADSVLVTGVTGFLGAHVAQALLRRGLKVIGSARTQAKGAAVRNALSAEGADISRLRIVPLDLMKDDGWEEAAGSSAYTIHTASPFQLEMPADPDALIRPAIQGTRRALDAALAAGHRRIVVTSSLCAIDGGRRDDSVRLGPHDWAELEGEDVNAYMRSKTLAEREAWTIADRAGARDRLVVINPGTMLGPLIDDDPGTSARTIQRMLRGKVPMAPDMVLPYVDVRDVAEAHVEAMLGPNAGGQRFIVSNPAEPLIAIADGLRADLPERAAKLPKRRMPDWLTRIVARFDRSLSSNRAYLGVRRHYDLSGGIALLQRALIPTRVAALATAQSLIQRRLA